MLRLLALLSAAAVTLANPPDGTPPSRVRVPAWSDASLTLDSLSAQVDGQPATVASLLGPQDELLLLVVFDLAGDLALIEPAREALVARMAKLPRKTVVGLLRSQDGLQVLLDPTADAAALQAAIRALPVGGRAGLLDTVETAAQLADAVLAKANVRAAVLYVTDSNIFNYRDDYTNPVINSSDSRDLSRRFGGGLVREKLSRLHSSLSTSQAPLFVVHLEYRNDPLNEAYQSGLRELTAALGGTSAFCRSAAEVPSAIADALTRILSHYSATLTLPAGTPKSFEVHLTPATHRTRFTRP